MLDTQVSITGPSWPSCFEVAVQQILAELCPFETFCKHFCFRLTPDLHPIKLKVCNSYTMMWSRAYYFEVIELCPLENFHKPFVSR